MIWHSRLLKRFGATPPSAPRQSGVSKQKREQRRLLVVDEMVRLALAPGVEPLVLEHAVEQRPARAHPPAAAVGVAVDRAREDAQRLRVALEPAVLLHQRVEHPLARVAERRMADVVREAHRLDQIRIDRHRRLAAPQPDGDRLRDVRHLQRMSQPRAVKIVLPRLKDLRLRLQAPESRGEHHPVPVLVEDAAVIRRAFAVEPVAQAGPVKRAVEIVRHFRALYARAPRDAMRICGARTRAPRGRKLLPARANGLT